MRCLIHFSLLSVLAIFLSGCGSVNYAPGRAFMVNKKGEPETLKMLVNQTQ